MFTSRAEYRLSLRQDNADIRLTRKGIEAGIVGYERATCLLERESSIAAALFTLSEVKLPRTTWAKYGDDFHMRQKDGKHKTALDILSMPDIELKTIVDIVREVGEQSGNATWSKFNIPKIAFDTVEAHGKYFNYISRQEDEMAKWKSSGALQFPVDLIYSPETFPAFSSEELEMLNKYRPQTLHEASQLQGLTPHSLVYLYSYITRRKHFKVHQSQKEKKDAEESIVM